jgi:hypothetical protein
MKNIVEILNLFPSNNHIRIEVECFMPLVVERLGWFGPRGLPLVSVAHYFEQNGDLCKDPEMTFEVMPDGSLDPISFEMWTGIYWVALWKDGDEVMVKPKMRKEHRAFARSWNQNIAEQGFVKAARQKAKVQSNRVLA